jgi:hypothetical protein
MGCGTVGKIEEFLFGDLKINFERRFFSGFDVRKEVLFDDEIFDHLSLLGSNKI